MTLDEYKEHIAKLDENYQRDKRAIATIYLNSIVDVKIGDTVKSDDYIFIVDCCELRFNYGIPEALVGGYLLTKKMEPRKDKTRLYRLHNDVMVLK